jgi:hypothetical protein
MDILRSTRRIMGLVIFSINFSQLWILGQTMIYLTILWCWSNHLLEYQTFAINFKRLEDPDEFQAQTNKKKAKI